MKEEKLDAKKLQEKLINPKQNGWKGITSDIKQNIFDYCNGYINYIQWINYFVLYEYL